MRIGQKKYVKSEPPSLKESNDHSATQREDRIAEFYRKVQNVPIQDDHALQLYQHWAEQAFSNLFAVIANQRLKHFSKYVNYEFGECSKRASTVPLHAKCISTLILGNFDGGTFIETNNRKNTNFNIYRIKKRADHRKKLMALKEMSKRHQRASSRKRWVGGLRLMDEPIINSNVIKNSKLRIFTKKPLKRLHILNRIYKEHRRERRQTGIVQKNYYQLYKPSKSRLSPIGKLAKKMMEVVLKAKGKKEKDVIPWQHTVERIKASTQKRNNIKKMLEGSEIKNMDQLVYNGLKRQGIVQEDLNDVIGNPEKLQQFLKKKRLEKEKAPLQRLVNLLRDGIKLGYAFTGQNSTELDNKTLKLVSPRFLSVTPEEGHNDTLNFLSPSLFSLHGNGKGIENLTSIPSLIKKIGGPVGFSSQDQQMWLDFIMEAAGVIEDAEKIEKELTNKNLNGVESIWNKHFDKEKYEKEVRTNDGTPLYFTKQNIRHVKKVDLFEELQRKTNINQIREMNQTGYSLLTKEQIKMIYGSDSPYHDPKLLQRFLLLNNSVLASHIENDIHKLATIDSFKIQPKKPQQPRRKRAIILSPISFSPFVLTLINLNPVILSPIIFSPLILAPAILGPVILSPWVFVPLVLSPRLLTPLILSPPLFSPLILSPLALQPVILSPGAFAPLILSPVLLSPFILSPQVFTPLILSPLALNPFILNPSALSPVILSPFVLSPIILSPAFLSALILSPYALSPLIQSPLIAYSVILSPSYLS
uniref:Uncharacterized protein n=1 Tax=Meloidogyne incognita TaxID=6306 RepID=A0A914LAJ2_MELIC